MFASQSSTNPPRVQGEGPIDVRPSAFDEAIRASHVLPGDTIMVVVTPVGGAEVLPLGFELADCGECRGPVWLRSSLREAAGAAGASVHAVCTSCLSGDPAEVRR